MELQRVPDAAVPEVGTAEVWASVDEAVSAYPSRCCFPTRETMPLCGMAKMRRGDVSIRKHGGTCNSSSSKRGREKLLLGLRSNKEHRYLIPVF